MPFTADQLWRHTADGQGRAQLRAPPDGDIMTSFQTLSRLLRYRYPSDLKRSYDENLPSNSSSRYFGFSVEYPYRKRKGWSAERGGTRHLGGRPYICEPPTLSAQNRSGFQAPFIKSRSIQKRAVRRKCMQGHKSAWNKWPGWVQASKAASSINLARLSHSQKTLAHQYKSPHDDISPGIGRVTVGSPTLWIKDVDSRLYRSLRRPIKSMSPSPPSSSPSSPLLWTSINLVIVFDKSGIRAVNHTAPTPLTLGVGALRDTSSRAQRINMSRSIVMIDGHN